MARSLQEKSQLKTQASNLFSPRTPIGTHELFAGRASQIIKAMNAIRQPGAHVIIHGERGVGKTSLANVVPVLFQIEENKPVVVARINCDGTDDYPSLWRKVFSKIRITQEVERAGLRSQTEQKSHTLADEHGDKPLTPGTVQEVLCRVGQMVTLIVILDEFDRLTDGDVPRLVADTIKSLSDSTSAATIMVVGVGDTVATLVRGHESVRRHLVEVPLPRMSRQELEKIVKSRVPKLKLTISADAVKTIDSLRNR